MSVFKNRYLLGFRERIVERMALKIWLKGCKNVAQRSSTIRNFHHICALINQSLFENLILDLWFTLAFRGFAKGEDGIQVSNGIFNCKEALFQKHKTKIKNI